jgi:hypothetical protein
VVIARRSRDAVRGYRETCLGAGTKEIKADRSMMATGQLSDHEIAELARATRPGWAGSELSTGQSVDATCNGNRRRSLAC